MAFSFLNRPAPDRRAAELEARLQAEMPTSPGGTRTDADPTGAISRNRLSLSQSGFMVRGRIVDSVAYIHLYKVQAERGLGTLRCSDSASTGLGAIGARQINTYPVGTQVLVYYNPQSLYHSIICALPDWSTSPQYPTSDFIFQGSNCGLQVDAAHYTPFTMKNNGMIDFSAGRPVDSLQAGEWGAISELGLRIFLDSHQVQVAVDEMTGLFLCYADSYARLSGVNLDIRSSGYCREDRDDESEFSSVEEYSPYPWETLGLYASGDTPFQELDGPTCQQDTPNRTRFEPVQDNQLGIYRDRTFRGYLGQGGKRTISLAVAVDDIHTYSSEANSLVGLGEENWALDGGWAVRSAQGIYIAKMPLIPAPKRKARPESYTGDRTDDAYASCGLFGSGPEHKIQTAPTNSNTNPHVVEPAVILDLLAYVFNWKGLHPFHYHNKDWYISEESDMDAASVLVPPPFTDLNSSTFLPQAPTFNQTVDDRYGAEAYYGNMAYFAILPNGSIVQVDGWGAEDRSTGGTKYINVPGDIVLNAGRSIVLQAGHDVIIKGNNCVDLSANNGHVRAAAHENVQIAGGLGGCGGVLIESRATGLALSTAAHASTDEDIIGGVVIRAKESGIVAAAAQIDLSTAVWGSSGAGNIIIDAGVDAIIDTRSKQFHRHIVECALDDFNSGASVSEYWEDQAIIHSQLTVVGNSFLWGDSTIHGDVVASGDVTAVDFGDLTSAQITTLSTLNTTITTRSLSSVISASSTLVTWVPDHTDLADLEFYFRDETQYKTTDFTICEPVWAQLARLGSGSVPDTWSDNIVVGDSHPDSSSYPGKTRWHTDDAYGHQVLNLFDPANMTAVDRGSDYETPVVGTVSYVTLNGNWPITVS